MLPVEVVVDIVVLIAQQRRRERPPEILVGDGGSDTLRFAECAQFSESAAVDLGKEFPPQLRTDFGRGREPVFREISVEFPLIGVADIAAGVDRVGRIVSSLTRLIIAMAGSSFHARPVYLFLRFNSTRAKSVKFFRRVRR